MNAEQRTPGFGRRLVWLAICVLAGLAVGMLGHAGTGDDAWFLALPGAVVLGWLYFGRPDQCARCDNPEAKSRRG